MRKPCSRSFDRDKSRALHSLFRAMERGIVDPDVIPLLSVLNSHEDYFTTSSCSGRIQLAATHLPGEKFTMVVLGKWHRPVSPDELRGVLSVSRHRDLWLSVQGPILHVVCRNLEAASRLLVAARKAGLKHSGLVWVKDRVVAELVSSDRVEAPLRLNGVPTVREEALEDFVRRVDGVLKRAKERLARLETTVRKLQ